MLKLINGKELCQITKKLELDFFGGPIRKEESEYKQLILDSQTYFEGIISGKISIDDKYYIYAPKKYLDNGIASEIYKIEDFLIGGPVCARAIYIKKPIKVKKINDYYIFVGSDGRHRYFVAQKYKLNLLVEVINE